MTAQQRRPELRQAGIGLRAAHHQALFEAMPRLGFLEVHAENYMGGGSARRVLERARRDWEVSLHGVGLSLGGAEPIDRHHLDRLADLAATTQPLFVSEHIAWCRQGGIYLNDLLPLPYTEEALDVIALHVDEVQARLGRRILMENPSTYLTFDHSPIPEGEFIAALARRTGCGLLLDVNNLYVNAGNHGTDPLDVMAALDPASVQEIHLAGHQATQHDDITILIDDHGGPVADPVWALYDRAVALFPEATALIEWDSNIPPLQTLLDQAQLADRHRDTVWRDDVWRDAALRNTALPNTATGEDAA